MKKLKTTLLVLTLSLLNSTGAFAQDIDVKSQAQKIWGYITTGTLLFALIATVVGAVIVYNAKSSSNPDDFKKKLMNWIYGVLFLYVAFGILKGISSFMYSSMNSVTF